MNPSRYVRVFVLLSLFGSSASGSSELLPGLKYYPDHVPLTGAFVFHLSDPGASVVGKEMQATVYALDLEQKELHEVARAPYGRLVASGDGCVFCVLFAPVPPRVYSSAFIYSTSTRESRVLSLGMEPRATKIIGDQLFFLIGSPGGQERIVEYNLRENNQRTLELPGASRWDHEVYTYPHRSDEDAAVLLFDYRTSGNRLAEGKDYPRGCYSLNVGTGRFEWMGAFDPEPDAYRAFDGRYIYFQGRDCPWQGYRLVSSPGWSAQLVAQERNSGAVNYLGRQRNREGVKIEVLKDFSKWAAAPFGRAYQLERLSPCKRYALVRYSKSVVRPDGELGWSSTYYLIDVSKAGTRVILDNSVERKRGGVMSHVYWVQKCAQVK